MIDLMIVSGQLVDGQLVDRQGRRWWTTTRACAQLRVADHVLHNWVARSKREPSFPRVDPPVRAGRKAVYLAQQLLDAERWTRTSTRGRRRAA